jgi:hypothetical protein
MLLLAGLSARAAGQDFPQAYWDRLERMLEFIAAIMDAGGNVPAIGDADDGILVRWAPERLMPVYASLLASGAVLFGRASFKAKAGNFDDKSRWLLGDEAAARFEALAPNAGEPELPRRFAEGGYCVLGRDLDTPREIRIVADAGPLGFLSIAAHGHADALAFSLSAAGRPILVDPGTFTYDPTPPWRHYFRSTAAHNTVTVDGCDQSLYRGGFLWHGHARSRVELWQPDAPVQRLKAWHDGYRRLADPVRHVRTLAFDTATAKLEVEDAFECAGDHQLQMHWHFAPECEVQASGGAITARRAHVCLHLVAPQGCTVELVRAREEPPLGWFAPSFDVREPATTVVMSQRIAGASRWVTGLRVLFERCS